MWYTEIDAEWGGRARLIQLVEIILKSRKTPFSDLIAFEEVAEGLVSERLRETGAKCFACSKDESDLHSCRLKQHTLDYR